jgi:hypothetical protein
MGSLWVSVVVCDMTSSLLGDEWWIFGNNGAFFGRGHFNGKRTILFDPHATFPARFADAESDLAAVHAEHGVIVLRHLFGFTDDVVANQRATKAVAAGVGEAAVDELAIEEKDVPGLHHNRLNAHPLGDGHGDIREALGSICGHGAQQGHGVATGHHLHAAIGLVAVVEGQPGRHAGAWLHAQVVLVLVQGLAAGAGWFEVEHGLYGIRGDAENGAHDGVDALVDHPAQAGVVPAVHVDHARVLLEWVGGVVVARVEGDAGEIAFVAALTTELHEMVDVVGYFLATEQATDDNKAVALVVCGVAEEVVV